MRYFSKLELRFARSRQKKYVNFQGCVYCLILNYHGSLLQSVKLILLSRLSFILHKQLLYITKLLKFCQQLFNYIFQKSCFHFKNLSASEAVV